MANKIRVVQAGTTTAAGNGMLVGAPTQVTSVRMPVQPKNKPWVPNWHPKHSNNNTF